MKEPFKLGLDIHGVLDANPEFFIKQAMSVLDEGGEVHIMTGLPYTPQAEDFLYELNKGFKYWTHYWSIIDELVKQDAPRYKDVDGRLWFFDDELWDKQKGIYCKANNIDLIYDDTIEYRKYMPETTSFMLYSHNPVEHDEKLLTKHYSKPPIAEIVKPPESKYNPGVGKGGF